eukprot:5954436-Amphidinium_carterae.1
MEQLLHICPKCGKHFTELGAQEIQGECCKPVNTDAEMVQLKSDLDPRKLAELIEKHQAGQTSNKRF